MKKFLIASLILIVLGGTGYFVFTRLRPMAPTQGMIDATANTVAITRGELQVNIRATGQVRPRQTATLSWQTSGAVEEVLAKVGLQVKAGDELANLAQVSLSQSIIQAGSELISAQQSLADLSTQAETASIQAMRDIVTYEQAVRDAQYALDNYTIPSSQKGMSAVEAVAKTKEALDAARVAFEPYRNAASGNETRQRLKDELDKAQSDYNAAIRRLELEYDLEVSQANLDKAYSDYEKWKNGPDPVDVKAQQSRIAAIQATLDTTHIEAPFDGTITSAEPLVGDQVSTGTRAFRIDDLSALYIDLQVSEIDVSQVEIGQTATIVFDAIRNQEYRGEVSDIALVGSQSSGLVNYTVTVKISDVDKNVRLGMTSEVAILIASKQDVLLVPNQAIKLENGEQVVYILAADGTQKRVVLTLGLSSDTHSEVLSGDLKSGDLALLRAVEDTMNRFFMGGGGPPEEGDRVERVAPAEGQP